MHEMGIATEILRIVESSIPAEMVDAKVRRVNLKVGRLSAIVPESLRFCFGVVAENTLVAGAELAIEQVPVEVKCNQCGHEWTVETPVLFARNATAARWTCSRAVSWISSPSSWKRILDKYPKSIKP